MSADGGMDKQNVVCTGSGDKTSFSKGGSSTPGTTWIDLEDIMLGEVS